jgi:hypothetical protein
VESTAKWRKYWPNNYFTPTFTQSYVREGWPEERDSMFVA